MRELPISGMLDVYTSIEYGRLVARQYAMLIHSDGAGEFASKYLADGEVPVACPYKMFSWPKLDCHPGCGLEPPNDQLSKFNRIILDCEAIVHVKSPVPLSSPVLDFAAFLNSGAPAHKRGLGSPLCPFTGISAALDHIAKGEIICLWEGCYPECDFRSIVGNVERPLFVVPRGYIEALRVLDVQRTWETLRQNTSASIDWTDARAKRFVSHITDISGTDYCLSPWCSTTETISQIEACEMEPWDNSDVPLSGVAPPGNIYDRVVFGGQLIASENDLIHIVRCRNMRFFGLNLDNSYDGFGMQLTENVKVMDCNFNRIARSPVDRSTSGGQDTSYSHNITDNESSYSLAAQFMLLAFPVSCSIGLLFVSPIRDSDEEFVAYTWVIALTVDFSLQLLFAFIKCLTIFFAESFSALADPLPVEVAVKEKRNEQQAKVELTNYEEWMLMDPSVAKHMMASPRRREVFTGVS